MSASRSGSPKAVIKRAVARTIDEPDSRFYQIGAILDYCGYRSRFGFKVEGGPNLELSTSSGRWEPPAHDLAGSLDFLRRHNPNEILWIDPESTALSFSLSREFATVIRREEELRREGILHRIHVYLERKDGLVIELQHASSGELSLISSLVFLVTAIEANGVILIDEPENSLHPSWQREYIDKVLNAIGYRDAVIVVATHAPLVVTGALAAFPDLVSVFQLQNDEARRLDLPFERGTTGSIEEVLWRAFEVVTPANHYVSEKLVGIVAQLERGELGKDAALAAVEELDIRSFDSKQHNFFGAVRELIVKVDEERSSDVRRDD